MGHGAGGLLEHARALAPLSCPTAAGVNRVQPDTFAPTRVHRGGDNRTVLARCIAAAGSPASRVECQAAGAKPHLVIAGILAAGADGIERKLDPGPMSVGDVYSNPGDSVAPSDTLPDGIEAYESSALADRLGRPFLPFSEGCVGAVRHDHALGSERAPDSGAVNDWERQRHAGHC